MTLQATRGARRPSVAVPRRESPRHASSCTRASGTTIQPSAGGSRRSPSYITTARSSSRTTSIRSSCPRAAVSSRTTPACRRAATRRRCTAVRSLDISPEDAERLGVDAGDTVRVTSRRGTLEAPGLHRPRSARRRSVHDAALPRRRHDEPAHDQRDRSEVRHRRVQGVRRARRAGAQEIGALARVARSPRGRRGRLMDLRLRHSVPTDDERAAVDALLGPPASAWDGGARGDRYDAHVAHGGREARERRHLLLPALRGAAGARRLDQRDGTRVRLRPARTCRRPRRGASRRSTRCSPRRRGRGACCTCATTSRAAARAPPS